MHERSVRRGCWGEYLGPRGMKLTREGGELHYKKFYNRYCLPNRLSVIKGQRMWWVRLSYFGTNKWWPKFGNQVLLNGYKELNQITEIEC